MTNDPNNQENSTPEAHSLETFSSADHLTSLPDFSSLVLPKVDMSGINSVLSFANSVAPTLQIMREQQDKTASLFVNTISPIAESLTKLNDYTNKIAAPLKSLTVDVPKWLTEVKTPNYFESPNYFPSLPTSTYYPGLLDSPVVQAPTRTDNTVIIEKVVSRITKDMAKEVAQEVLLQLEIKETRTISIAYPIYDAEEAALVITGKVISIRKNTREEDLAKIIFADEEAMAKDWSWDEIVEGWDSLNGKKAYTAANVYTAANGIKEKIAKKTSIEDYLITTRKTVRVNPKYLD